MEAIEIVVTHANYDLYGRSRIKKRVNLDSAMEGILPIVLGQVIRLAVDFKLRPTL
jgi:hypothetical protein